jgi:hypothetical protein
MICNRLIQLTALTLVAGSLLTGCGDDGPSSPTVDPSMDFRGAYAPPNWMRTGIADGTTEITPNTGTAAKMTFAYDVFLGNPAGGVSYRDTEFALVAPESGTLSFDWTYSGFHSWYSTEAVFIVFSGDDELDVEEGEEFGFIVGGKNFDSNSRLRGTLEISNFHHP